MFELTDPTRATITSVTLRREMHGDDRVPAVSLGIKIVGPNTILDKLDAGLLALFYTAPAEAAAQAEIEGTQLTSLPLLRSPMLDVVNVKGELEGWSLHIDYGIDDSSAIRIGAAKVDKFRVELKEGGSVELKFRVGTSDVDETSLGKLSMLIDSEVSITLTAPEAKAAQTEITEHERETSLKQSMAAADAKSKRKKKLEQEAGDAFAAAHTH
jgi:hypothetical protein